MERCSARHSQPGHDVDGYRLGYRDPRHNVDRTNPSHPNTGDNVDGRHHYRRDPRDNMDGPHPCRANPSHGLGCDGHSHGDPSNDVGRDRSRRIDPCNNMGDKGNRHANPCHDVDGRDTRHEQPSNNMGGAGARRSYSRDDMANVWHCRRSNPGNNMGDNNTGHEHPGNDVGRGRVRCRNPGNNVGSFRHWFRGRVPWHHMECGRRCCGDSGNNVGGYSTSHPRNPRHHVDGTRSGHPRNPGNNVGGVECTHQHPRHHMGCRVQTDSGRGNNVEHPGHSCGDTANIVDGKRRCSSHKDNHMGCAPRHHHPTQRHMDRYRCRCKLPYNPVGGCGVVQPANLPNPIRSRISPRGNNLVPRRHPGCHLSPLTEASHDPRMDSIVAPYRLLKPKLKTRAFDMVGIRWSLIRHTPDVLVDYLLEVGIGCTGFLISVAYFTGFSASNALIRLLPPLLAVGYASALVGSSLAIGFGLVRKRYGTIVATGLDLAGVAWTVFAVGLVMNLGARSALSSILLGTTVAMLCFWRGFLLHATYVLEARAVAQEKRPA